MTGEKVTGALVNKEKRSICPYNNAHIVPPERLALHLAKCRKQNPDTNLKICTFDATHHVKEEELQSHIESCSSKDVVEKCIYIQRKHDYTALPQFAIKNTNNNCVESEENWESEQDHNSYNPHQAAIDKPVFRQVPTGLGKSARRVWRVTEEERIKRIQKGLCIKDLKFPTPDGSTESIDSLTLRGACNTKASLPVRPPKSKQFTIAKNIMRVDSSKSNSEAYMKSRFAAGLFDNSVSTVEDAEGKKKKRPACKPKIPTQSENEPEIVPEMDSIFTSFSKTKFF